jgi:hypothetical protein
MVVALDDFHIGTAADTAEQPAGPAHEIHRHVDRQ